MTVNLPPLTGHFVKNFTKIRLPPPRCRPTLLSFSVRPCLYICMCNVPGWMSRMDSLLKLFLRDVHRLEENYASFTSVYFIILTVKTRFSIQKKRLLRTKGASYLKKLKLLFSTISYFAENNATEVHTQKRLHIIICLFV